MKKQTILVCGDRKWSDKDMIKKVIEKFPAGTLIIHGGAKGADTLAGEVAEELGYPVRVFVADWKRYGIAAGPLRNIEMLIEGKPNLVVAFHKDLTKSRGTANMVKNAKKKGIEVKIYPEQSLEKWFKIILGKE